MHTLSTSPNTTAQTNINNGQDQTNCSKNSIYSQTTSREQSRKKVSSYQPEIGSEETFSL